MRSVVFHGCADELAWAFVDEVFSLQVYILILMGDDRPHPTTTSSLTVMAEDVLDNKDSEVNKS